MSRLRIAATRKPEAFKNVRNIQASAGSGENWPEGRINGVKTQVLLVGE